MHMIWAATDRLGCGMNQCDGSLLLVCNYQPSGDINSAVMYQQGPPCFKCPSGTACKKSLCSKNAQVSVPKEEEVPIESPQAPISTTSAEPAENVEKALQVFLPSDYQENMDINPRQGTPKIMSSGRRFTDFHSNFAITKIVVLTEHAILHQQLLNHTSRNF